MSSMSALFELPDMSSQEMEQFLEENRHSLSLTHLDCAALRIRRRRRSVIRRVALEEPVTVHTAASSARGGSGGDKKHHHSNGREGQGREEQVLPVPSQPLALTLRIVVLGDDCSSKFALARHLYHAAATGGPAAEANLGEQLSLALAKHQVSGVLEVRTLPLQSSSGSDMNHPPAAAAARRFRNVEVFVPPIGPEALSLRMELLQHCDVVMLCYTLRDRATFHQAAAQWANETKEALHRQQRDRQQADQWAMLVSTPHPTAAAKRPSPAAGNGAAAIEALLRPPALVFVGLDGEMRSMAGSLTPSVSSQEAVKIAQQLGARKYIEVSSTNAAHYRSLLDQCLAITEAPPLEMEEVHQWKGLPLWESARAPPPHFVKSDDSTSFVLYQSVDQYHQRATARHNDDDGEGSDPVAADQFHCALYAMGDWKDAAAPAASSRWVQQAVTVGPPLRSQGHALPTLKQQSAIGGRPGRPRVAVGVGLMRGFYPSPVVTMPLPREAPPPEAHVDPVTQCLIVAPFAPAERDDGDDAVAEDDWTVRVAFDNDDVHDASQAIPYIAPISLRRWPESRGRTTAAAAVVPKVAKLVTYSRTHLCSRVVTVTIPPVLEAPKATLEADGTLIVQTRLQPHAAYHYTLDGSAPGYDSPEYTRPVTVPLQDGLQVRLVALPRLALPSNEVVVTVAPRAVVVEEPQHLRSVPTTRAATIRSEQTRRSLNATSLDDKPFLIAPGSRHASPVVTNHRSSPKRAASPRRSNGDVSHLSRPTLASAQKALSPAQVRGGVASPVRLSAKGNPNNNHKAQQPRANPIAPRTASPHGTKRSVNLPPSTAAAHHYEDPHEASLSSTANPQQQQQQATAAVAAPPPPKVDAPALRCNTKDNEVAFQFPRPIRLSHITVVTPGEGKGPGAYEVFVMQEPHQSSWIGVGAGTLEDLEAVQTLMVIPSARLLPVTQVRCVFSPCSEGAAASGGLCEVRDMKIHGKPFHNSYS